MSTGFYLILLAFIVGNGIGGTVAGYLCYRSGRHDGWQDARACDRETILSLREKLRDALHPAPPLEIRAKTGRLPTGKSNYTPGDFRLQLNRLGTPIRAATTADDLKAPVIVPEPGMFPPQPGGTGPLTETMPRVSDTGELRALNAGAEAWIANLQSGEAAWRAKVGLL